MATNQATGGFNYDYVQTGGISTRGGHEKVNASADTNLDSIGLGLYFTSAGAKTVIRGSGTKIQKFTVDDGVFTNLTEDTASAGSTFMSATSVQPLVYSEFNTATSDVLWQAGGGVGIYGVYSATKVTANGTPIPTGTLACTASGSDGTTVTGSFTYAVAYRKLGTQAISNAALDQTVSVTATNHVSILITLTNFDATKYDKVYLYRSSASGGTSFTTGDLVAQISSSSFTSGVYTYTDLGPYVTTATTVPRAGSSVLDNSVPNTGAVNVLTTFKRRLVYAQNSTLYFSDLNKSESFPTLNTITIPSGGPITGLAITGFSTDFSNDEILVVFKERELWIVTGSSISDYAIKFVDTTGCASQRLVVQANGWLTWVDYRGIYIWDGSGKPIYVSRPIETLFDKAGDLDKSNLQLGHGFFYKKKNQVIWYLSHKTYGINKYSLKMDLRLTLPKVESTFSGRIIEAVFIQDTFATRYDSSLYFLPSTNEDELALLGDDSGYVYKGYNATSDASAAFSMNYDSKHMDMGNPETEKRFMKVIVWVNEVGSYNLTLDYWTDYSTSDSEKTSIAAPIAEYDQSIEALYDIGYWDVALWDQSNVGPKPIVFNLSPGFRNANEGKALKIRFRMDTVDQPINIQKFSVVFTEKGQIL